MSQDVRCNMEFKGEGEGSGHWMLKELMRWRGATSGGWGLGKECSVLSPPQHEMRRATDATRGVIVLVSMTGAELTFNRNSHTGRRKG